MARLTPEAVLRTHQIYPYKDIKLMVERHGFDVREGNGTSHVMVSHPEHTDLLFTLNQTPGKKRDYQHEAAKACVDVLQRDAEKEIEVSTDHQGEEVSFPDDMTATTKGDVLVIRHKNFPCIGLGLRFDPDKNGIANIVSRRASTLRDQASALRDLIKTATQDFGIQIAEEGKNLVVTLPKPEANGRREVIMGPYNILTNENPIEVITEAIDTVSEDMRLSGQFWQYIEEMGVVTEFEMRRQDAQPHAHIVVTNGLTKHTKTLSTPIAEHDIVSDEDQARLLYEITAHLFEPGTFKALQSRFGVSTAGKTSSTLRLRQPIFDLERRITNPRPLLDNVARVFNRSVEGESIRDMLHDLTWLKEAYTTWNEMNAFAELVRDELRENRKQVMAINDSLPFQGIQADARTFKKLGEPFIMTFTGGPDGNMRFSTPVMRIKIWEDRDDLFPPGKLAELKDFIDDVKTANSKERMKQNGGLAVLANPDAPQTTPLSGAEALEQFLKFER